jgi:hypothetical protein
VAKAEKEFAARKADILSRAKAGNKGGSAAAALTADELAVLEGSDDDAQGEAEIQRLVQSQSGAAVGALGGEFVDSRNSSNSSNNSSSGGASSALNNADIKSHVSMPTEEDISALLVAVKRKALLERLSVM